MSSKPRTLVINTMTESKYMELSAAGKISDKQLNIVDNDDAGRTVIASYDIVNEKVKNSQLSLSYDEIDGAKYIRLVDKDGNEQSKIPAAEFIKDGMLNGIEYRATNDDGGALWFTVSADGYSPTELSVMLVDSELLSASTNAVQNQTVYSAYSDIKTLLASEHAKIETIDSRLSDVENDYVRYTAVPTPALSGRRAIILENGDLITGKTYDGSSDRHLIGIAGSDRDIINIGSEGIQLNLNTANYDCGPLGTLNAINVNGGSDFVMTNGAMPMAVTGDGSTIDVQTREIAVPPGVNVKQLVISTDAESKANSYTDSEILKLSAEVSTVYQTKADSQTSAAALDIRLTNIENDYLISADKTELQGKIDEKADSTTLVQVSSDLSAYADSVGENAIQSANEYANSVSGEIRTDLDDLSGTVMTILSDYALSSDVSSKAELEEEFKKYQLSGNYLSVEVFENTISDYALSSDVSSKTELSEKFNAIDEKFNDYYTSAQTSSSNELAEEFKKYQLSGNYLSVETFENTISDYALSSDVSSKTELAEKFKKYQLSGNYLSIEVFENTIKLSVENLSGDIAAKAISITDKTTSEGYLKSYTISQGGMEIGAIDIPKDFLVKSGEVKTCDKDNKPIEGYKVGDKYLDFVVNVAEGISAEDQHIYINVKDLTDVYSGTNGTEILVIVDSSNQISAVIQAGAINKEKIADSVYGDISSIASSYVENRVRGLDAETVNGDVSRTISKITETGGIVSAEFTDISVTQGQVSGLAGRLNAIDEKFKSYYPSSQTSSSWELSNEFAKYALSSDVSGKTELNTAFETLNAGIINFYACMWNAISAHTVNDEQLKSADQLSVDDIIYSFHNMAANLSVAWAQLNNA